MVEKNLDEVFEQDFEEETEAPEAETVATSAPEEAPKGGYSLDEAKVDEQDDEKQWYVVNTYSGREKIVADYLEKRKISMNQENYIFRIVVPEREELVLDKNNKPVMNKKTNEPKKKIVNLYPGYIFVEANMTDLAWYIIRNTPGVTGLVGSSGSGTKPFPIPKEDMLPILKEMNLYVPEVRTDFAVGDVVYIAEGAFAGQEGTITSVNDVEKTAEVNVVFFGRLNEVVLPFSSLDKSAAK